MARSTKEIKQQALDIIAQEASFNTLEVLTDNEQATLQNLTSNSRVSAWNKFVYLMSLMIHFLEVLMDKYESRVSLKIDEQRVHTILWYQNLVLAYQHGAAYDSLGSYDNSNRTDAEIEAMKVFKHAAITRTISGSAIVLRAKVAGESNGEFTAATDAQVLAARSYLVDNADAGTLTTVTSGDGDDLLLKITIHFDPTVLDADGKRLDGTNDTPVLDASKEYLKQKELNDSYVKGDHEHVLRQVEGVRIAEVNEVASKFGQHSYSTTGNSNAGVIEQIRVADSGYFKIDDSVLEITYKVY